MLMTAREKVTNQLVTINILSKARQRRRKGFLSESRCMITILEWLMIDTKRKTTVRNMYLTADVE